jgi:hypothetical protein
VSENEPVLSCVGDAEESCGTGLSKFALALAVSELLDVTVAVTVTAAGAGTLDGAEYKAVSVPVLLITPTEEFPPGTAFTDHVI